MQQQQQTQSVRDNLSLLDQYKYNNNRNHNNINKSRNVYKSPSKTIKPKAITLKTTIPFSLNAEETQPIFTKKLSNSINHYYCLQTNNNISI